MLCCTPFWDSLNGVVHTTEPETVTGRRLYMFIKPQLSKIFNHIWLTLNHVKLEKVSVGNQCAIIQWTLCLPICFN